MSAAKTRKAAADPLETRIGYLLRRVSSALMTDLARSLARLELRPVEASLLIVIGANPHCKQTQIGQLLGIKGANLAPLIAALEARKLIEKAPMDGRSHALFLTASGRRAAADAERLMDAQETQMRDLLGETNCRNLALWLRKLRPSESDAATPEVAPPRARRAG